MRDRWVALFALLCLLQLPLYVRYGKGPLTYDFAIKAAERTLVKPPRTPREFEAVRRALQESEDALRWCGPEDSRTARLNLNKALLAWHEGRLADADGHFLKAVRQFEAYHGADSFHACAVNLRYGEFLMLTRRYEDALVRFGVGVQAIEETLGPGNAFAVRMVFRQVTLLVYLGRSGQAAALAERYLPALLQEAGRYDEAYLTQTAGALDALARADGGKGRFRPPGGPDWRTVLLRAYQEGKKRLAESPEESG
jgi:hypothetical protein